MVAGGWGFEKANRARRHKSCHMQAAIDEGIRQDVIDPVVDAVVANPIVHIQLHVASAPEYCATPAALTTLGLAVRQGA